MVEVTIATDFLIVSISLFMMYLQYKLYERYVGVHTMMMVLTLVFLFISIDEWKGIFGNDMNAYGYFALVIVFMIVISILKFGIYIDSLGKN